jgi:hypothetical protein
MTLMSVILNLGDREEELTQLLFDLELKLIIFLLCL